MLAEEIQQSMWNTLHMILAFFTLKFEDLQSLPVRLVVAFGFLLHAFLLSQSSYKERTPSTRQARSHGDKLMEFPKFNIVISHHLKPLWSADLLIPDAIDASKLSWSSSWLRLLHSAACKRHTEKKHPPQLR